MRLNKSEFNDIQYLNRTKSALFSIRRCFCSAFTTIAMGARTHTHTTAAIYYLMARVIDFHGIAPKITILLIIKRSGREKGALCVCWLGAFLIGREAVIFDSYLILPNRFQKNGKIIAGNRKRLCECVCDVFDGLPTHPHSHSAYSKWNRVYWISEIVDYYSAALHGSVYRRILIITFRLEISKSLSTFYHKLDTIVTGPWLQPHTPTKLKSFALSVVCVRQATTRIIASLYEYTERCVFSSRCACCSCTHGNRL